MSIPICILANIMAMDNKQSNGNFLCLKMPLFDNFNANGNVDHYFSSCHQATPIKTVQRTSMIAHPCHVETTEHALIV